MDHEKIPGDIDEFTQHMVDLAAAGVDFFETRFDGLDYSLESIAVVEELLAEASDFYENMDDERRDQVVGQIGAYVFEVARREFGGRYFWLDQRNQPILVTGMPVFEVSLVAYDKVRGRLAGDPADNIPFFFDGYLEHVRNAQPGEKVMIV